MNGTASVSVSGGTAPYTYIWNTLVVQTTASVTGLSSGTYLVYITDANGCSTSCSVIILEPAALSLSISHTDIGCNGLSTGTATVSVNGGTAPYVYIWNNGATTASISNLAAGIYTVTVTDNNMCSASASVIISQDPHFPVQ